MLPIYLMCAGTAVARAARSTFATMERPRAVRRSTFTIWMAATERNTPASLVAMACGPSYLPATGKVLQSSTVVKSSPWSCATMDRASPAWIQALSEGATAIQPLKTPVQHSMLQRSTTTSLVAFTRPSIYKILPTPIMM